MTSMTSYVEFSREIGGILGRFPFTVDERELILKETAEVESIEELPDDVKTLLLKVNEARALPKLGPAKYSDKLNYPNKGKTFKKAVKKAVPKKAPAVPKKSAVGTKKGFNPFRDKIGQFAEKPGGTAAKAAPAKKAKPAKVSHTPKGGGLTMDQWNKMIPSNGFSRDTVRDELDKTPDGRQLMAVISDWQNSIPACKQISDNFMKFANGKKLLARDTDRSRVMMDAIEFAPASPPIFRGSRFPLEKAGDLVPGKKMVLPPGSWTTSRRIASGFAKQVSQRKVTPVVFDLPTAKAFPINAFGSTAYDNEKEWITAGEFMIESVTKRNGVTVVKMQHVGHFSSGVVTGASNS